MKYQDMDSNIMKAEYIEQTIPDYKENPLIEALPPIYTNEEIYRLIGNFPEYNHKHRELPIELRLHCVDTIKDIVIPMNTYFDVEHRISRMIRHGYIYRNPLKKDYVKLLNAGYEAINNKDLKYFECMDGHNASSSSLVILGISGIGKTTMLKRLLGLYPQAIVHTDYKGNKIYLHQITYLRLECPFDGSIKGLCFNFFQSIDKILKTDYYSKFSKKTLTVDQLLPIMTHVASIHTIGVLVIDEIQNLSEAKSGGADKMLNFFVQLVNTIGLPVILVGTPKAMEIFTNEFRNARRGSSQGDLIWDRMKNDDDWKYFIEELWNYQWTTSYTELTKEILDTLYDESQGITDIAVKLFMMAQWRAIESEKAHLDIKLIKAVARDHLKLVKPMLEALRQGILTRLNRYKDICFPDDLFDYYIKNEPRNHIEIVKAISVLKNKQQYDKVTEITQWLIQAGISSEVSIRIAKDAIKDNPQEDDISILKSCALKKVANVKQVETSEGNTEMKSKKVKNDNKGIVGLGIEAKQNSASVGEILLRNDIIKTADELF